MYFQYDSAGAPIGFVYNDVQYLYITNISGDVAGITDAQGNLIAEYTYDAWGKLLDITTAEENNEEQLAIANANPLRYRGYYYDNETGYYYLQSRYYNPEWGRFISADDFDYIDAKSIYSTNAYAYCKNSPIEYKDPTGYIAIEGWSAFWIIFSVCTGLILVYMMIWVVVSAVSGIVADFSVPSPSIPSAAERADAHIRSTIKRSRNIQFWIANRIGNYVAISSPLDFKNALFRVSLGADVFAVDKNSAYILAYASCEKRKYPYGPEIDMGKEYVTGYYWHYHPNPKNGAHIFYL